MDNRDLDVDTFVATIENFNSFFIRLSALAALSFTTLSVLHTLAYADGPLRLAELTSTEQVTQPAITQLVTRLERDGLVRRGPDPRDGRAVLVHITDAGRQVVRDRRDDRTRKLTPLLDRISADERRAIAEALPALIHLAELGRATGR